MSLLFLVHMLHDEQMLLQSQSCGTKHRFHHYEHFLAPQERFVKEILNVVEHVIAASKIASRDCQRQPTVEQSLHILFFQDSQAVELKYEVSKIPSIEPCNRDLMSSWVLHKCAKYQICHAQS